MVDRNRHDTLLAGAMRAEELFELDELEAYADEQAAVKREPACPQCDGPSYHLGRLGATDHYRCRNCGYEVAFDA